MMQEVLTNQKGYLFVVSAPAGTGKNTLVNKLKEEFITIIESISVTTREPRVGEVDGKDYFFVTKDEFEKKVKEDAFLEHAKVFDHYYGTSKEFVEKKLFEKKHVVLVIDTQGAMQIQSKEKNAVFIFIAPPSKEVQIQRLHKRASEDQEELKNRLDWSSKEMEMAKHYDYLLINDDLDIAYQILRSIFIAQDHKSIKNK